MSDRNSQEPDVGFVVIGRNEGERLVRCIDALERTHRPIVYVDSASTDGSAAAARGRGATVIDLDMSKPFSPGRARNAGYGALTAAWPGLRYVQFLDGDCELIPGWLEAALAFGEQHEDAAAICGRRRERHPETSVYNRLCDAEWNTPVGESEACGGDALIRCTAFDAAGGYDPGLMAGEEPELCLRLRGLGWKVWRLDQDMTLHDADMTRFRQWWLRGVRSGFGYAQVWNTTRATGRPLYQREIGRAFLWAGLIPLASIGAVAVFPPALLAPLAVYGLQIVRLAVRSGIGSRNSWERSFFLTFSKFPELVGVARFGWRAWRGRTGALIEYKAAGVRP